MLDADTHRAPSSVVGQRNGARTEHLATLWCMAAIFTYLDQRSIHPFLPCLCSWPRTMRFRACQRSLNPKLVRLFLLLASNEALSCVPVHVLGWMWMRTCVNHVDEYIYIYACICVNMRVHVRATVSRSDTRIFLIRRWGAYFFANCPGRSHLKGEAMMWSGLGSALAITAVLS